MNDLQEGKQMERGISFLGLVTLASGTVTGVGFLMMSGDIVSHVGSFNLVVTYIVGMIAEIFAMLAAATLASSYPSAGSVVTYARKVLNNHTLGFLAACALWLGMIAIDGAELMALGRYIYYFLPQMDYYWWGVIVTIVFIAINLLGVSMTSKTQSILGLVMWSGLMSVPLIVLSSGQTDISYWQTFQETIGFNDWMTAIFFGVYCYVGFVTILPAAEETVEPEIRIPKAMLVGTLITGFFYITGGLAITTLRPTSELLALADNGPFASVWVKAMEVIWNGKGAVWMNSIAIITSLTTANACVYGGARMLYGMARERQLPESFRKISERFRIPIIPIIVTGGAILFCVLTGAIRIVSVIANFVFFPLWGIIGLASYKNLSNKLKANGKLSDKIPFYIPGGRLWPVVTIIMAVAFTIITFLATDDVIFGGGITVVFFVVMWLYYILWNKYNKNKGIDIVTEAEKYETIKADVQSWEA